jgi:hypothetical protein
MNAKTFFNKYNKENVLKQADLLADDWIEIC